MTHRDIDREALRRTTASRQAIEATKDREARERARERERQERRRPVAIHDGPQLHLRQPRLHLLFGRPYAWVWLGIMAPFLLLLLIAPWWVVPLALAPFAIPWSCNAWRLSATVSVTPTGNVGVSNGLWRKAACATRDLRIELTERGLSGWLGECVIEEAHYPVARILGLTERDFETVTRFAAAHGIAVARSRLNYSVTVSS